LQSENLSEAFTPSWTDTLLTLFPFVSFFGAVEMLVWQAHADKTCDVFLAARICNMQAM